MSFIELNCHKNWARKQKYLGNFGEYLANEHGTFFVTVLEEHTGIQ